LKYSASPQSKKVPAHLPGHTSGCSTNQPRMTAHCHNDEGFAAAAMAAVTGGGAPPLGPPAQRTAAFPAPQAPGVRLLRQLRERPRIMCDRFPHEEAAVQGIPPAIRGAGGTPWRRTRGRGGRRDASGARQSRSLGGRVDDNMKEVGKNLDTELKLQGKPRKGGGVRWNSRNRRRKPGPATRRRQRLQTSAARTRLAGSTGGRRRSISSTSSCRRRHAAWRLRDLGGTRKGNGGFEI
jgi:hypothetical protein